MGSTVKVYRARLVGAVLWICVCIFSSGLGVCPELGMKNGLNQSRFHRDKLLSFLAEFL